MKTAKTKTTELTHDQQTLLMMFNIRFPNIASVSIMPNISIKEVEGSLSPLLNKFFPLLNYAYSNHREALIGQLELVIYESVLRGKIGALTKLFIKPNVTTPVIDLIPELTLALLDYYKVDVTKTPTTIKENANACIKVIEAAYEVQNSPIKDQQLGPTLFYIAAELPGFLNKTQKIDKKLVIDIAEKIKKLKLNDPNITHEELEKKVLEIEKGKEKAIAKHLEKIDETTSKNMLSKISAHFPYVAKMKWANDEIYYLNELHDSFFSIIKYKDRIPELGIKSNENNEELNPEEIKYIYKLLQISNKDATVASVIHEATLIILNKYKLLNVYSDSISLSQLNQLCIEVIKIGRHVEKHVKFSLFSSGTEEKKDKACQAFFLKIRTNPYILNSDLVYTNLAALEKFLGDELVNTEDMRQDKEHEHTIIYLQLQVHFPHLISHIGLNNNLYTLLTIKEKFLSKNNNQTITINNPAKAKKLLQEDFSEVNTEAMTDNNISSYMPDLMAAIMLRYQLLDYVSAPKDAAELSQRANEIINAVAEVEAFLAASKISESSREQYKPLMVQIAVQMPGGYQYLKKINAKNLKEAIKILKNRGAENNDNIKQRIALIGNNNDKKIYLNGAGITEVRNNKTDLMYEIYQKNKSIIDAYLKSKNAQQIKPAEITENIFTAFANAKGNPQLFELYLNHHEDREYIIALNHTNKIQADRDKVPFKDGDFYCQTLLIQHYLAQNVLLKKINFSNKGQDASVNELAQCLANLHFPFDTRTQCEAIVTYYNEHGSTPSFEYLNRALEIIKREHSQLEMAQTINLIGFLVMKTCDGSLQLNTDELELSDLCTYYNTENEPGIGSDLIAKRDKDRKTTYDQISKEIDILLKDKQKQITSFSAYRDSIVHTYAYYQDNKTAIKFVQNTLKNDINTNTELEQFHNKFYQAHQRVMALKDKSLLELEYNAPNASVYKKSIDRFDDSSFDFYQRINFAKEYADIYTDNKDEIFEFAFNYPNIAFQCNDIDTLNEILGFESKNQNLMQLKLFLMQAEAFDSNYDSSELINTLTGSTGSSSSSTLLSRASFSSSNRGARKTDDQTIKRYITAFYLIDQSAFSIIIKNELKVKLAVNLQTPTVDISDKDVTDIYVLAKKLSFAIEKESLLALNDDWSLITDDEAKVFSGVFKHEIKNKADLVYAFYYFSNYPASTLVQMELYQAVQNYLQNKNYRAIYLKAIVDAKLDKNQKYENELKNLNNDAFMINQIAQRVNGDNLKSKPLVEFFKKYPVIQTAIDIKSNPNWSLMYDEISEFIKDKTPSLEDINILVEIALLYPGLLKQLPLDAHLSAYKKLTTEFAFIKDDVNKREIIIELCKNPNYKQQLLNDLGLHRKFIGKPHHQVENNIRDQLLDIHFKFGHGLSAYFNRFKSETIPYISSYTQVKNVEAATTKNLAIDDNDKIFVTGKNKNESFLVHLHWSFYSQGDIRQPVSTEFANAHREFTKLNLNLPHTNHINLRNMIVELELEKPGHMQKFKIEAEKDLTSAVRKYTYLYKLKCLGITKASKNIDFEKNEFFIIYKNIMESTFLAENDKNYLIKIFIDNSTQPDPKLIKLVEFLGIYPLFLKNDKFNFIKKYSLELNEKIGLFEHKNLPNIGVSFQDLLYLVNNGEIVIKNGLISKEDKIITNSKTNNVSENSSFVNLALATEICNTFIEKVKKEMPQVILLKEKLEEIECTIPGILDDIYNEFYDNFDGFMSDSLMDPLRKLTSLTHLLTTIEQLIEATPKSEHYHIRKLVIDLGKQPDLYQNAKSDLLLDQFSKKQLQPLGDVLPRLILAYKQFPFVIRDFINDNKSLVLAYPLKYYVSIIEAAEQLNLNINENSINLNILNAAFMYPALAFTIHVDKYLRNIEWALNNNDCTAALTKMNDIAPMMLYCLQFAQDINAINAFTKFLHVSPENIPNTKQRMAHLAHYLSVIQKSNLSDKDKSEFCAQLFTNFSNNEAFNKFNDSLSHIAHLAGYDFQTSLLLPKNNNLIPSLISHIKALKSGINYTRLLFSAGMDTNKMTPSQNGFTMDTTSSVHFKKNFQSVTNVNTIENDVIIDAGCVYYSNNLPENKNLGAGQQLIVSQQNVNELSSIDISGPLDAQQHMLALTSVYDNFITKAFAVKYPGVNFLRFGSIEPSFTKGLNKDWSKYYHITSWQQENVAAATYSMIAHSKSSISDIYKGRENDNNLKLNAASQLFEDGLMLYSLLSPIVSYVLKDGKLIMKVNFTKTKDMSCLNNMLDNLLEFNDLKQFNHGICSQANLKLIARLFATEYSPSRDNIATLLYRYQNGDNKSPFTDKLYTLFSSYLCKMIDDKTFLSELSQYGQLASIDSEAQTRLLQHMKAITPQASNTSSLVLSSLEATNQNNRNSTELQAIQNNQANFHADYREFFWS